MKLMLKNITIYFFVSFDPKNPILIIQFSVFSAQGVDNGQEFVAGT
jgi:hypothetical protein